MTSDSLKMGKKHQSLQLHTCTHCSKFCTLASLQSLDCLEWRRRGACWHCCKPFCLRPSVFLTSSLLPPSARSRSPRETNIPFLRSLSRSQSPRGGMACMARVMNLMIWIWRGRCCRCHYERRKSWGILRNLQHDITYWKMGHYLQAISYLLETLFLSEGQH